MLLRRVEARSPSDEPVVVTGDFNAGEDNPAVRTLNGRFVDTFRVRHPDERQAGTFTGFTFDATDGPKIDYVFVEPGTLVMSAAILRTSRNRRYPSDHFPVVARVRLRP